MKDITLFVGYTSVAIKMNKFNKDIFYILRKFTFRLNDYVFDRKLRKFVRDKNYFLGVSSKGNDEQDILVIPRNYLSEIETFLDEHGLSYSRDVVEPIKTREINSTILPHWIPREDQKPAIDYLITHDDSIRCLALQTGCLAEDSKIAMHRAGRGFTKTIKAAHAKFNGYKSDHKWDLNIDTKVRSLDESINKIHLNTVLDIIYSGVNSIYRLTLENGRYVDCTKNHLIRTNEGWEEAQYCLNKMIMCDQKIAITKQEGAFNKIRDKYYYVSKNHPYVRVIYSSKKDGRHTYRMISHRVIYEAHLNNMTVLAYLEALKDENNIPNLKFIDPNIYAIHHKDFDHFNNDIDNLEVMTHQEHATLHSEKSKYNFNQGIPFFSKCINFEYLKEGDTYDICCEDPHNSFTANDIVVHNCGKTFSSIYAAIQLNKPFIIIASGLVKQWYDNVVEQTDIPESDIYVIRGADSIREIIEKNLKPKAIIASLETIRNFAQNKKEYHDFEYSPQELFMHLEIGTKIVDECHENFHGIVSIDLAVNVEVNIYLSATYIRNNQSTHKIFDIIFPPDNRFGEGNYDKYININMFEYSSFVPTKYVNIGGTYSHFNYEKYLLKHERGVHWFTHSLLKRIINDYYIAKKKPGQKLLILMATLDNINKVVEQLRKIYPDLSILPFTAKDKEENLEADVIVSTIGSSGTGRDIPNLLTTILTVSIKAEGAVKQIVGRLRKLKDGSEVYFCDIFNEQSESQVRHKMVRSNLYLRIGKTYTERRI